MRSLVATIIALAAPAALSAAPSPAGALPEQVSLNCDAISYRGVLDQPTVKELEPVHDLDKVASVLTKRGIAFDRGRGVVTLPLPPKEKAEIDALPPGEPIILPSRAGGVVCVLVPAADSV